MSYKISFPRRPFRRDKSSEPIKTTREFITEIDLYPRNAFGSLMSRKLLSKYVSFNKAVLAMILQIAEGPVFHDHLGFPLRPFTDLLCIHHYHPTLYTVEEWGIKPRLSDYRYFTVESF